MTNMLRKAACAALSDSQNVYQRTDHLFSSVSPLFEIRWCLSFFVLSLFHSEITWTEPATTCWAWPGWLKMCLQRSPTSSSRTWKAGGSNPTLHPLPTHPQDTRTITHRSDVVLSAFEWGLTACSCSGALRELSAFCFCGYKRGPTHREVSHVGQTTRRAASYCFSIFMCWFVSFLLKRRCKISGTGG